MKPSSSILLAAAVLIASRGVAMADGQPAVADAWARATPPHADSAAVYLTITDPGPADRLLAATTPVAADAHLHESRSVDGVMQMRSVDRLDIATGGSVTLAPGGLHLMLTGLRQPLHEGEHFPVTLRFEKAGAVTVQVNVAKIGATMAPMPGMDMN